MLVRAPHVFQIGTSKCAWTVSGQFVEARVCVGKCLLEQCRDQHLLGAEVVEQTTLADSGFLGNASERHRLHAVATHHRGGRIEQLRAGLSGTGLPWSGSVGHSKRTLALPYAHEMSQTLNAHSLVPTVDLSNPSATELAAVDAACRDHGFFLLVGHGANQLITDMWEITAAFFAEGEPVKGPIRRDADNALGYWDRELTKRKRDNKEVFDYIDPTLDARIAKNRWPGDAWAHSTEFNNTLTTFFDAFSTLATDTLGIVRSALGLSDTETAEQLGFITARTSSTVRLNHYPVGDVVPTEDRGDLAELGPTALGYHTDPGVLTLLLQDGVGGLQAESTTHGWIDVPPLDGAIVVNLGDAMQVWTNDQYKAAVHRVVPMTRQSRYSIPYFANPPRDAQLAPLASVLDAASAKPAYRAFTWADYISGRAQDNFADYGVEDIQISHFKVGTDA